jgi:hypothetical protein
MPGIVDKRQVPRKQSMATLRLHDTLTFSLVSSLFLNFHFPIHVETQTCFFLISCNRDADNCFRKTRFMTGEDSFWAFIGDSRIRQLYIETLQLVDPDAEPLVVATDSNGNSLDTLLIDEPFRVSAIMSEKEVKQDEDVKIPLHNSHKKSFIYNNPQLSLRIMFFWRPIFNQTTADLINQLGLSRSVPHVVVAGSGSWNIKGSNGSQIVLDAYSQSLQLLANVSPQCIKQHTQLLSNTYFLDSSLGCKPLAKQKIETALEAAGPCRR